MTDEAELIERARAGDAAAGEALARSYLAPLWRFANRYLHNPEDAADAVQETWLRAFRALPTFRRGAPFAPWLWRIAANVCTDIYRRRRRTVPLDEVPEPAAGDAVEEPTVARLDQEEIGGRLARAIERLPDQYRRVIELHYAAGLPVEEIARVLGVPSGTVKTHLHRARERLRRMLGGRSTGRTMD